MRSKKKQQILNLILLGFVFLVGFLIPALSFSQSSQEANFLTGNVIVETAAPAPEEYSKEQLANEAVTLSLKNSEQQYANEEVKLTPTQVSEQQFADAKPSPSRLLDIVDFKETDLSDVLKAISQKSGLNIVGGSNVTGKVTLYLTNVDVREVLKIITQSNNLAFIDEGNLFYVMPKDDYERMRGHRFLEKIEKVIVKAEHCNVFDVAPLLERMKGPSGIVIADAKSNTFVLQDTSENIKSMQDFLREIDIERKTEVFELTYAKADEISEKINSLLTPNAGTIRFDKRSNKVSVTDTPNAIESVRQLIKAFDVRNRQVIIEAKIIQVVLSDQYQMGINWEAIVAGYHNLNLAGTFDVLSAGEKRGAISVGTLADDNYEAMIEALSQFGNTNNLANPHIIAVDGQEARILVGSTEPYVTTTTTTPGSGPATLSESVNFIQVGVKLYVTPTIHKDNFITMKIKPEVSSVNRVVVTSNNNTIPVVDTSEAETTVTVKDGVTIVIGGLIKDEKINTDKEVPVLGQIPILGALFSSKDHLTRKTELVIILTPKIITGDREEGKKAPTLDIAEELES